MEIQITSVFAVFYVEIEGGFPRVRGGLVILEDNVDITWLSVR